MLLFHLFQDRLLPSWTLPIVQERPLAKPLKISLFWIKIKVQVKPIRELTLYFRSHETKFRQRGKKTIEKQQQRTFRNPRNWQSWVFPLRCPCTKSPPGINTNCKHLLVPPMLDRLVLHVGRYWAKVYFVVDCTHRVEFMVKSTGFT